MSPVAAGSVDIVAAIEQEGTKAIVKAWLKQVGDAVAEGDPIAELETDKVAMEVAAPASGVLSEILVQNEQEAAPGAVLGRITSSDAVAGATTAAPASVAAAAVERAPAVALTGGSLGSLGSLGSIASFDPALRLSPSVRRALLETGLDPATLLGTGRGGRLTRKDVDDAAAQRPTGVAAASAPGGAIVSSVRAAEQRTATGTRIPHDTMRRRIAEHMSRSVAVAPHVTALFEADFSAIMAHRKAHKPVFERQGVNLTLTAYIVAATVEAMKAVPVVNSRWHDDFVEVFDDVNIGIGTALGDKGLIVPVVHRSQALSLMGIASRLQEITALGRAGKLSPADVQNGTFTISNHGVSGSLTASPIIINQPQSAILGVGKVEKRVIVREIDGVDAIQIRPMSYVTLTIDHRVIDGAQTNAWLSRFVECLERWPLQA